MMKLNGLMLMMVGMMLGCASIDDAPAAPPPPADGGVIVYASCEDATSTRCAEARDEIVDAELRVACHAPSIYRDLACAATAPRPVAGACRLVVGVTIYYYDPVDAAQHRATCPGTWIEA